MLNIIRLIVEQNRIRNKYSYFMSTSFMCFTDKFCIEMSDINELDDRLERYEYLF